MNSQNFTLRLRLPPGMTHEEAIERLDATDCIGPLVGIGKPGVLALKFDGPVALSALAEMAQCIPQAVVLSFSSDEVHP